MLWNRLGVVLVLLPACFGDTEKLFTAIAAQQTLEVGGTEATVTLGRGRQRVELLVPANVLPARAQLKVSVVSGTVRRGRHPATDTGVLIDPVGTTFQAPVRIRQLVPPPPPGRSYRSVVVPDNGNSFVARGPARLLRPASAETEGYEQWESDAAGSGLWGLALAEPGDDPQPADAGTPPDAGGIAPRVACAPATANACAENQSCVVTCLATGETEALCVAAGTKQPGELCTGAGECAPGAQCYNTGCNVSVCRKYCTADAQCPVGGSCSNQVGCATPLPNNARLCSQPCDPRGAAQTGCAAGLRCLLFPGEVADCGCHTASRAGLDGAACADTSACAPGFICVNTGTPMCRPICRLDQPSTCAQGRGCQRLTDPDHVIFGACTVAR